MAHARAHPPPAIQMSPKNAGTKLEEQFDEPVELPDGDTIEIHSQRIRLWGIDAPESDQLCRAYIQDHNNIRWLVRPPYDGVNESSRYPYILTCLRMGGASSPFWCSGANAPTNDAPIGALYSRIDGSATTSLYVKTAAGAGNWTAK
jgi:hypothetical protein